jgi:hypothetical protein
MVRRKAQSDNLPFFSDDEADHDIPFPLDEEDDMNLPIFPDDSAMKRGKKKKKQNPKVEVGSATQDKDKLRVFAALIFAYFGGNVTVKEAGDGKLLLTTLAGNKWRILLDGERVNISGYPNLPNFTNFVGKLADMDLLSSLTRVSEALVREVQQAEKVEAPSPPVSFQGIAAQPSPIPPNPMDMGLQPANPLIPGPDLNAPGMPPLPPDQGGMGMLGQPSMGAVGPPPPEIASDMGMAPQAPIPTAMPQQLPPPPPGQMPGVPPDMNLPPLVAARKRTASHLDTMANRLEMAGHKDLAARLDLIANSLEKEGARPQKRR